MAAVGGERLIAHVGHWAVNLLYVAPLLLVVGVLGFQTLRDRRRLRDGESPRRPPEDVGTPSG